MKSPGCRWPKRAPRRAAAANAFGSAPWSHSTERDEGAEPLGNDGRAAETIESPLASLEQRDYVVKMANASFPGEQQFAFKHKLERQKLAALTSEDVSRKYHQTIADWMHHHQPEHPTREHLALLAYHFDCAGAAQAGPKYLAAADAARATYAFREADEYYGRGLHLLADSDARRRIDALHNHGDVLTMLGRTDEALTAFREMLGLAYRLDLRPKRRTTHNRLGRLCRAMQSLSEARRHLETALTLFGVVDDQRGVAACHDDIGMLLWTKAVRASARTYAWLSKAEKIGDRRSIALSLHNIGVVWRDHGATQAEALEASLRSVGNRRPARRRANGRARKAAEPATERAGSALRYAT